MGYIVYYNIKNIILNQKLLIIVQVSDILSYNTPINGYTSHLLQFTNVSYMGDHIIGSVLTLKTYFKEN